MTLLSLVLVIGLTSGAAGDCNADDQTSCTNPDHSALLQNRVRVSLEADAKDKTYTYGPYPGSRKLMDYFKAWGQGKLANRLARTYPRNIITEAAFAQLSSESFSAEEAGAAAGAAFMAAAAAECPNHAPALAQERFKVVESEPVDADGVRHVLLRNKQGGLQYLAVRTQGGKHQALVADPPVCRSLSLAQQVNGSGSGSGAGNAFHEGNKDSGEAETLDLNDPVVKDCVKLFHRTVKENCKKKDFDLKVLAATASVVDGLSVHLNAKVCHKPDDCHMHHPECDFEESADHHDAQLLQVAHSPESQDLTDQEKHKKTATLRLHVPLCDADTTDAKGMDAVSLDLMEKFTTGENSRSKGFEHVNDDMPHYSALDVGKPPHSVDLRTKYPACFPALSGGADGSEVVRNQGTCGSCWAFASASMAMANLCISNNGVNKVHNDDDKSDRMEVAVQKVLSCAPEGEGTQSGCNGGNMKAFDKGARKWGLTAEKDNKYKCGGGDPHNHFDQNTGSCDNFPWGGSCTGQPQDSWKWGGSYSLNGEDSMLTYLASGYAMYGTLDVYKNFFDVGSEIYTTTSGAKKGGHAVVLMGYGVDAGTKYWTIQNSWGTSGWGEQGFGRMLRGDNLCGIEDAAYGARAWVAGGNEPPCMDSDDGTGLSSTGSKPYIPCDQAKGGNYGDLCAAYETAKLRCPLTCGFCVASNGSPAPPAPPTTTAPPPPCSDDDPTGVTLNGSPASCDQLGRYCSAYSFVRDRCPATCNSCP